MRPSLRLACLLLSVGLLLGSPASLLAGTPADTDSIAIEIPVVAETGILAVSGTVDLEVPPITSTMGATVTGLFALSVTDTRIDDGHWHVVGAIYPFESISTQDFVAPSNLSLEFIRASPYGYTTGFSVELQSDSVNARGPSQTLLSGGRAGDRGPHNGYAEYDVSLPVPEGLATGNYRVTFELFVYAGDPP